jgi:branched-subunit amino acid aminotransferase/4-amino-4-deoxychorismate lyase
MSRYAYVNGRYLPMRDAKVHIEDRGYQFSDGVYEVCEVQGRAAHRRAAPSGATGTLAW